MYLSNNISWKYLSISIWYKYIFENICIIYVNEDEIYLVSIYKICVYGYVCMI
jgi:hypothetical protein